MPSPSLLEDNNDKEKLNVLELRTKIIRKNSNQVESEPEITTRKSPSYTSVTTDNTQTDILSFLRAHTNTDSASSDSSLSTENTILKNNQIDTKHSNMADLDVNLVIKVIPEFDGNSDELHRFTSCCEIIHNSLKVTETIPFLNILKTRLKGKAYEIIKFQKFESWAQLKSELELQFGRNRALGVVQLDLLNCKQLRGESVRVFANRVEKLLYELNDVSSSSGDDKSIRNLNSLTALRVFQEGLIDSIKIIVKACRFTTLRDSITRACDEEALLVHASPKPIISSSVPNNLSYSKPITTCQICHKKGHSAPSCYSLRPTNTSYNSPRTFVPSSSYRNQGINQSFQNKSNTQPNIMMCNYCRKQGHDISECFKRQRVNQTRHNLNSISITNNESNKLQEVPIQENPQGLEKSNIPSRVRNLHL